MNRIHSHISDREYIIPVAGYIPTPDEHPLGSIELDKQRRQLDKEKNAKLQAWVDEHRLQERLYFMLSAIERTIILLNEAKRLDKKLTRKECGNIKDCELKWNKLRFLIDKSFDEHMPVENVMQHMSTMRLFLHNCQHEGSFLARRFGINQKMREVQKIAVISRLNRIHNKT